MVFFVLTLLSFATGCAEPAPPTHEPEEQDTTWSTSYNAATTGTILGRVTWEGEVPAAEEKIVRAIAFNPHLHQNPARYTTPHVPKVHPTNHGVADAIVFLRDVDPGRSRPWDHAKARVEFHERRLEIVQGESRSSVGIVRRGSAIDVVNCDEEYHNLHGRGAAFFALPLLKRDNISQRLLTQTGRVDLTCGAGYYWLHAHLLVVEHPYYARTDAEGRFALDRIPSGTYELVCWLPSWRVLREERDPETGIFARLQWAPPLERVQTVRVQTGERNNVAFRWDRAAFE